MLEFLTSPIYRVNNFVHDRNPSVERQYFQQQFGFPINLQCKDYAICY